LQEHEEKLKKHEISIVNHEKSLSEHKKLLNQFSQDISNIQRRLDQAGKEEASKSGPDIYSFQTKVKLALAVGFGGIIVAILALIAA